MKRKDFMLSLASTFLYNFSDKDDKDWDESWLTTDNFDDVIESLRPSVFKAYTDKKLKQFIGTCFFYNDYILTAYHIIPETQFKKEPKPIYLGTENTPIEAILLGGSKEDDIAILGCDTSNKVIPNLPCQVSDASQLRMGDFAFSLGYGYNSNLSYKSGQVRTDKINNTLGVTIPIVQGDSGSPVFALQDGIPKLVALVSGGLGKSTSLGAVLNHVNYAKTFDNYIKYLEG